jgi:3'-phosphoadenosine 5'-phosphosulfate sulfotransferase (PAPS reductase)/FAD synthetase/SAM-dependent methyltransferase
LFILENEAMDFVEHTYKVYRKKMDFFAVSFSGGKDSQVVLDIVSRILPPEDFIVIFSDTTMEIPFTYEAVERTKKEYQKRYPNLKFYTAKPPKDALEFWKEFGPPSRIYRWCCTVTKTAPFVKRIKDLYTDQGKNDLPKILVFDGVRREESSARKSYSRLAIGVKHPSQINAEVIQNWNLAEVFLYTYFRNLELNKGYRFGLSRIGCSLCPFASDWSDFILYNVERNLINKYMDIVRKHVNLLGIHDKDSIREYISQGQWKKRGGGEGVDTNGTGIEFTYNKNRLKAFVKNPRENFLEWLKVIGGYYMPMNDKNIEYYNLNAEELYIKYNNARMTPLHQLFLKEILPGNKVLDIGFGSGRDLKFLKNIGCDIWGVDSAEKFVKMIQRRFLDIANHFTVGALPILSLPKNYPQKFDIIILIAVWMHIPKELYEKSIKSICNLLQTKGKIIISYSKGERKKEERSLFDVDSELLKNLFKKYRLIKSYQYISNDSLRRNSLKWITEIYKNDEC